VCKLKRGIVLIGVALIAAVAGGNIHAQPGERQLPADLLFSAGDAAGGDRFFHTLSQIDAQTLNTSYLYVDGDTFDTFTHIRALGWSPSGNYLAIIRLGSLEVCILNRAGERQSCFADKAAWLHREARLKDYLVTWSEDEQHAYLMVDLGEMRSLIEANVTTEQTERILYQYDPGEHVPPMFYWTPDLAYVAVFGTEKASNYDVPFRAVTITRLDTEETHTFPAETPELGTLFFCDQFSPQGHYLVAQTSHEHKGLASFGIFDLQGNLIQTVSRDQLAAYGLEWVTCPNWQASEEAFYFRAIRYDTTEAIYYESIFKYSLADQTLTLYAPIDPPLENQEVGSGGRPVNPLVVSPDGEHLALEFQSTAVPGGVYEIGVVFPDGALIRLNESPPQGRHPLWVPPLVEVP
jgi:hypothetical protein